METGGAGGAPGARGSPRGRRLDARLALAAVVGLGAGNFLWQLGSSSYFVDEILSIQHALPSLGAVTSVVTRTETTPWTYFWGLHIWLHVTGSQAEWVDRLTSALAGIVLIATVYWMARAFMGRRGSLLAAALTALSPLVLTYAQRVRVYVFVMVALVLAVGLVLRAVQQPGHRSRRLATGATAAILAMWLHYTAALVIVPLCVWLAIQPDISRRARTAFTGACAAGLLAELPLFLRQYHYAPNGGVGPLGGITSLNVVRIIETPFDGRFVAGVNAFRVVAAAAIVLSVARLMLAEAGRLRCSRLLASLGLTAPLAILILGLAGKDVAITRYTAVAAPLLLTGVAAAVITLPRGAAVLLGTVAAAVSIWGLVRVHERSGFYPPAKEAIEYIRAHDRPGAVVVLPGHPGADVPLSYYAQRLLHPAPPLIETTDQPALLRALHQRRPVWLTTERRVATASSKLRSVLVAVLRPYGYTPALVHQVATSSTFIVDLVVPGRGR